MDIEKTESLRTKWASKALYKNKAIHSVSMHYGMICIQSHACWTRPLMP